MKTKFICKKDNIKIPLKKYITGLIIIQGLCSLSTLFTASLSESVIGGVSVSYLGCFISGLICYILHKKRSLIHIKFVNTFLAFAQSALCYS